MFIKYSSSRYPEINTYKPFTSFNYSLLRLFERTLENNNKIANNIKINSRFKIKNCRKVENSYTKWKIYKL